MRLENSDFVKDYTFGEVTFVKPASEEDMEQGIDAWIGGIPFAWRRRRISVNKYGEISVRHSRISGYKTELDKLLDGSFKSLIYIFQFTDAVVICLTSDIVWCLKKKEYTVLSNPDSSTAGCYIKLKDITHLLLKMPSQRSRLRAYPCR